MSSLQIIYASTSGHTEYVIQTIVQWFNTNPKKINVSVLRAELAKPEDFSNGDVLLLATSTWNTGGPEGQLNPHMFALLERAAAIDLKQKKVAIIGLGDDRYRYTAKAADHMDAFVRTHQGQVIEPILRVINEPYTQEEVIQQWIAQLLPAFT